MAGNYNYKLDQGRTWRRHIVLYADRSKTTFFPLAGFKAVFEIRPYPLAEPVEGVVIEPLARLTTENGGITITPSAGKIAWILEKLPANILAGEYLYELYLINTLDEEYSILKGKVAASPKIARP